MAPLLAALGLIALSPVPSAAQRSVEFGYKDRIFEQKYVLPDALSALEAQGIWTGAVVPAATARDGQPDTDPAVGEPPCRDQSHHQPASGADGQPAGALLRNPLNPQAALSWIAGMSQAQAELDQAKAERLEIDRAAPSEKGSAPCRGDRAGNWSCDR
ncbi:hypothetical protein [Xanthobacter tagetidis]|uniref:hypothetical protein n=1 Tax=Xanthobacter tagetidis TaxID=60216 RepID=UPI0011C3458F|nr:hypothetical protein [Xanthobacter tagetidis]MBB6306456.1 hypothetical protein [Xanthobacter tagetidis]